MNNVEVCYQGRLPEYENEIAVSGKFCDEYGYEVGDELELQYGGRSYRYLITGLVQTCNNSGKEAVLSKQAAEHIIDFTGRPSITGLIVPGPMRRVHRRFWMIALTSMGIIL